MNAPLPGPLADNPALNRWLAFPAPGKVTVYTGRVEFGQGVLTAMAQIAGEELDVSLDRITVRGGDTAVTANEGYTAGSFSMQAGAVALRQACVVVPAGRAVPGIRTAAPRTGKAREGMTWSKTTRHCKSICGISACRRA